MSFYGNVRNTARTQFYFDRIYPNRYSMDDNAKKDNIFAGRYVLVEYEQDISADDFQQYYYFGGNMYTEMVKVTVKLALDPEVEIEAVDGGIEDAYVRPDAIADGSVCCIPAGQHYYLRLGSPMYICFTDSRGGYKAATRTEYEAFYKKYQNLSDPEVYIIDSKLYTRFNFISGQYAVIEPTRNYDTSGEIQYWRAVIEEVTPPSTEDNPNPDPVAELHWETVSSGDSVFQRNFNIDKGIYKDAGRTYDSTVWQKVYVGNEEKYIMIADLNTITPTFSFTADAPTVTPVPIHYDPNNTNTNYNIHMQGPWGLRVRGANGSLKTPTIDHNGRISDKLPTVRATKYPTLSYPSDFNTQWAGTFYDVTQEGEKERLYSPYTGKWNGLDNNRSSEVPGAIYINRKGFDKAIVSKSEDVFDESSLNYDSSVTIDKIRDSITLAPTGYSGRIYNDHLNNEGMDAQPDTQELVIMLPSLGDAISDIWDMVYGGRDTNDTIEKTGYRNLDFQWEYANEVVKRQGLRAVRDDNGRFDNKAVDTLAGCINTVHDILGMIIVRDSDSLDISKYEDGYIYQFADGSYRRKTTKYDYSRELTYSYEPIVLSEVTYAKGHFYLKNGSTYTVCNDEAFDSTKSYYVKKIAAPQKYQLVTNLGEKPTETLFYKTPVDPDTGKANYKVVVDIAEDIIYYKFASATEVIVTAYYEPYKFYYEKADGYYLDTHDNAQEGMKYHLLVEDSIKKAVNQSLEEQHRYDSTTNKYILAYGDDGKPDPDALVPLKYIYCPDVFYKMVIQTIDGKEVKTISKEVRPAGSFDVTADEYYIVQGNIIKGDNAGSWVQNPDGSFTTSDETTNLQISGMYKVELLPWADNFYYYAAKKELMPSFTDGLEYDKRDEVEEDEDLGGGIVSPSPIPLPGMTGGVEDDLEDNPLLPTYIAYYKYLTQEKLKEFYDKEFTFDASTAVFTKFYIPEFEDAGTFYRKNTFYFRTDDGSFAIDKNEEMTVGRDYFLDVNCTQFTGKKFYVPNKYYIIDPITGEYVLDKSLTFKNVPHYIFNGGVYVLEDTLGLFAPHSEWNETVLQVPASVRLCYRDEMVGTENLVNFGRGLNTIHGLILQMNKMLEIDNFNTRERTSLQGCINVINDIINKFDKLIPNNFAIIDDYGRVNTAHWSTVQKTSSTETKASGAAEIVLAEGVGQDKFREVASVSAMRGQWLTLSLDSSPAGPKFTIHHNFQKVTDTTSAVNKNTDNVASSNNSDKISLYTPIVDAMGHVVGKNTETVTLPYGFKTIASGADSTAVTELSTSHTSVVADNTQDTFTINTGNKWIRTATNATNDSMTFAHALSPISTQANTAYGLQQDETVNLLDTDNTFEVPVFKFDEAGHIIFAETHTVTIPEVFENVKIVGSSTNTDDTSSTDGTVSADSLSDTLNFSAGNKWIQMSHDATTDTITFKHYVKKFSEGTAATDLDNSNTFTVQELSWDNAGHLTGSTKRTYTLQDGFKNLAIANSGATTTTAPTAAAGTLTAATQVDTATLDTSNRWITLVADATNKKVTIGHAAAGTASTSKGDTSNQTPKFGSTFKVLSAGIDQTGHVSSLSDHTVTIPTPSLTNGTGNVVTGMSLVAADGAFTETKAYVGTLALTNYTAPSNRITGAIAATDTINSAFATVQSYLYSLSDTINNLDDDGNACIAGDGKVIGNVTQSNGKISVVQKTLTAADIPSLSAAKINDGIFDVARIPDLNANKITEGTLSADRLPTTVVHSSTKFNYVYNSTTTAMTIEELLAHIATLEQRIKALEPTT